MKIRKLIEVLQKHIFADGDIWVIYDLKKMYDAILALQPEQKDNIDLEDGYKLIPMSEITDEARELAVAWMECEDKQWIGQKHKLASDIMNYAIKYHKSQTK